jgi:signal transduction histidine kinase
MGMAENSEIQDIEQRVYLERVRVFFRHAVGTQVRSAIAIFFVGLSLYYADVSPWNIGAWAGIFAMITVGQAIVELRYRYALLTPENAKTWVAVRVTLGMATGIMMGAGAFLLPAQGNVASELMIYVVLITGVSITFIGYTTMPAYSIGVASTSMGLLALDFLRAQDRLHYTLAVMVVISLYFLIKKALEVSRTTTRAIRVNEQLTIVNEQLQTEVDRRHDAEREAHIARDVALKASSAKSDFLANMSHELRTPMNAVIGFSGALKSGIAGPLNGKQTEYVEDIQNSGEHLLTLINDLLDLSKIEAGKFEVRPETFDLPEQIGRCLPLVRRQAETGSVALYIDIPDDLPMLHADRRLVRQMIVNLLSNAIKFSPEGGRVTFTAGSEPGGKVTLSVTDNGAGMPAEEIPRVMQPFEQTELGKTKEGTGLGLPLVQRIAELHGGEFVLESALGEGTVATILLPADCTADGNKDAGGGPN